MDNGNSNYSRYMAELKKRVKAEIIDLAPPEKQKEVEEEIYEKKDFMNTQEYIDDVNTWDEDTFKTQMESIQQTIVEWKGLYGYSPNYLKYLAAIDKIIEEFMPTVPDEKKQKVREEIESNKSEKMCNLDIRAMINSMSDDLIESLLTKVNESLITELKEKYLS